MLSYHEIRKLSPEKARAVICNVLQKQKGNVSKTAKILRIQRKTVRRARDGTKEDLSRKPHTSPARIESKLEDLIAKEGKATGYRYRRLSSFLKDKYGLQLSENTVKKVLKRKKIKQHKVKTRNKRRRPLYDYENLEPFQEMQLDTKHVLDVDALPEEVYVHMLRKKFPPYEWNIIDAATRIRFTAYSFELSATFGRMFIMMVLLWVRMHGIQNRINIQADNGSEFCRGSKRKEEELNQELNWFGATFRSIPVGKKYLQAIVENSHRHDDEQFLSIHPLRCQTTAEFMAKAQRWQDTWNTARKSWGIDMNGVTPLHKLKQKNNLISKNVLAFPVLLLENLFRTPGPYVRTNYLYCRHI